MITRNAPLTGELKTRRHMLGWTLKELGERCAIDEGFLRDWEGGVGSPRLDACDAWAAALGLKLALVRADQAARNGLAIDWKRRTAAVDGTPVRLTPMEWKALERLATAPGELVSHQTLFRHLYGERPYDRRSTAIRVLITKLRRLLPLRIEAQWGRGYVVSGIAASASLTEVGAPDESAASGSPAPRKPESNAPLSLATARVRAAVPRPAVERGDPTPRRSETLAVCATPTSPRTEELRVIERFLAERGATRCPDVAAISQSPLPTLVWDKVKRKWVRPGIAAQGPRPDAEINARIAGFSERLQ
jgi:DNA-binding winged helix-turn-helix (wHTH) protein